ncbi:MAG: hypothetical protein E6J28_07515 [Chloroflexi bacterium]|nr:MAG: hypothetical protein E6J28_07515 [Chloroflexota bacterium]
MIRNTLIGLLVVVIAALTYPGALLVSLSIVLTPPAATSPGPPGALPWLHVAHPSGARPYIADEQGRMVLLHGTIPASLVDYWSGTNPTTDPFPGPFYPLEPAAYDGGRCPSNSSLYLYPPLCQDDIAEMAELGFNSVRLPLTWSLLEPRRGEFNRTYLDRIAQVVDWARERRMYVIIDMHQNAYSRFMDNTVNVALPGGKQIHLDSHSGAPAWATITDAFPSEDYFNKRELNPAVFEAFNNFWYDRDGVQDEYIDTLAFLAQRFKDDSTVAGFSVFNEPLNGWNLPPGFDDLLLFPFYRRVIDALTGMHDGLPCWSRFFMPAVCGYRDLGVHDTRHLVFIDTGLGREVTDFPTHLAMPVSSYPNVVLGVHAYTHIYTFDTFAGQPPDRASYPWGGYEQGFDWADREAKAMNAALLVMEFGDSPEWDHEIVTNVLLQEEKHRVGFMFWTWKENGDAGKWGIYSSRSDRAPCLRAGRERLLARVYPRVTGDPNATFHYDSADGRFTMRARGNAGDPTTVVYVPREAGGLITSDGAATVVVSENEGDGSRLVFATPTGGAFTIAVSAAPLRLSGCTSEVPASS